MTNFKNMFVVINLLVYFFECSLVEGKTLDPIYWNSSNPMFKAQSRRRHYYYLNAGINDKLDLICPRRDRGDGEELFYFKLYLVSEEDFRMCNTSKGTRLLTCDVPEREKKYTFYFQEISPSPWGLEFKPGQSYYVISTSDGSENGMDGEKGGVCTRFNMKIELRIHPKQDRPIVKPPVLPPNKNTLSDLSQPRNPVAENERQPENPQLNSNPIGNFDQTRDDDPQKPINNPDLSPSENDVPEVTQNGLIIGIVLGACAVLFILLLSFLGYKVYRKRRRHKKYQSPPMTPTRGNTPMQQVTLLPIGPPSHHSRLLSDVDRHPRPGTLSSHNEMRPPPSYNESFLDNGGPVVAV